MKDYYTLLKAFLEKHFPAQLPKLEAIKDKPVEVITMYNMYKRSGKNALKEKTENSISEENIGLADLGERGYEAGTKAAYTYATLVGKLQNRPDKLAYNKGFIQGVTDELGSSLKEKTENSISEEDRTPNLMNTLMSSGKVNKPTGGASMNGKYYHLQGGTKYDVIHFDYDSNSEKPFGVVQVAGHHLPTNLLNSLGFRETRSWTAGVEVYIADGNLNPKYISEEEMAQLVDEWGRGVESYAKTMGDFYKDRGKTSGTIDEAKATCCHRCGRVHVKGTPCKKPYLKGKKSCAIKEVQDLQEMYKKIEETKSAPEGHYFTKSGNLVKGRMTKDAEERGARKSDPKDKMRSKIPKVTQYAEAVKEYMKKHPKMKKSKMMEAIRNIIAEHETDPALELIVGDYQTKHYHMCPGAKALYQDIESKGVDMDLAVGTAKLQDALFAMEEEALDNGATEVDLFAAETVASQIMDMARMMGLEEEHSYIQGHITKIKNALIK